VGVEEQDRGKVRDGELLDGGAELGKQVSGIGLVLSCFVLG
jgi:hypothetical protein